MSKWKCGVSDDGKPYCHVPLDTSKGGTTVSGDGKPSLDVPLYTSKGGPTVSFGGSVGPSPGDYEKHGTTKHTDTTASVNLNKPF